MRQVMLMKFVCLNSTLLINNRVKSHAQGKSTKQGRRKSRPFEHYVKRFHQTMRTSSFLQFILFLTIAFLEGCASQSPAVVTATSTATPIIELTSFPTALKLSEINLEFSGYKVEKDLFTIIICFAPPTKELWYFDHIYFSIEHLGMAESWVRTDTQTGRPDGFSCGNIAYPIDSIPNTGKAKLSIGQLKTPDDGNCDKAQQNLDKAKTDIVIRCDPSINNGLGFVIVKKPIFMKDGEAIFKAQEAFCDTYQVNWQFSFFIEKP